jgi:transcription antitermination factor NusG
MTAPYWCVARSEPNRESVAARFLGKSGYDVYLPKICEVRSTNGRRRVITPPLFPAYLFVRIELQWHTARWSIGVVGLIMAADGPAKVPDAIIDGLRAREQDGCVMLPEEEPRLRAGDPIRVTSGLLMGATGLFAGMRPQQRVEVLLTFLGSQRSAVLQASAVERVGG